MFINFIFYINYFYSAAQYYERAMEIELKLRPGSPPSDTARTTPSSGGDTSSLESEWYGKKNKKRISQNLYRKTLETCFKNS